MRRFEIISLEERKKHDYHVPDGFRLPARATSASAGYDFTTPYPVSIPPHATVFVPTLVKARMERDDVLLVFIRSSLAVKRHLSLANSVGVVDSDYYSNPDNDGHIMVALVNGSDVETSLSAGERFAQGLFMRYYLTDDDLSGTKRSGGFGSSGK